MTHAEQVIDYLLALQSKDERFSGNRGIHIATLLDQSIIDITPGKQRYVEFGDGSTTMDVQLVLTSLSRGYIQNIRCNEPR